jgi:ketosteroid isomerase-like protein
MNNLHAKTNERTPPTNEEMVTQYFKFIENKDIGGILELFDYDATVYEPFSKSKGLQGKSSIEPFLKVAVMANSKMKRTIEIQKSSNKREADPNRVVALITFEKGDSTTGRFTFEFTNNGTEKKIKSIHIEFP